MRELHDLLTEAGLDVSPERPGESRELVVAEAAAYEQVLADCWSLAETAHQLGTTTEEVRRLLARGRLYGFKERQQWCIPRFQFEGDTPLPGIDQLVGSLDAQLGPVSVQRFATQPNEELLADGIPLSPVEWLAARRDPDVVARIAVSLSYD